MRKGFRYTTAVLCVSAAAGSSVVAVGAATASTPTGPHNAAKSLQGARSSAGSRARTSTAGSRALLTHFKVLRRARIADISSATQIANPQVVALLQLNVADTELVQTSAGPVWIVPGNNGACVISGQAAATPAPQFGANFTGCDQAATMLDQGLMVHAYSRNSGSFVFGVVPDGNSSVTITSASGAPMSVPVVDNTFAVHVSAARSTVGFVNAAGAAQTVSFAASK